ncbi:phage tail tip lysozyme [Arthrobacter rhizosphaerae]|uniref:phage tail tip lysozyme n=1 Tax=Arthrobacter rhizosphaerae TaxID=2855490 RepID=UPI001FF275BA|nr:phage tail tip lysozyme [Arthrobacter rhizosphaerae]
MATDKPEKPDASTRPGGSPDQSQGAGHKVGKTAGNDAQRARRGGQSQGRSNAGGSAGAAASGAVPGTRTGAPGAAAAGPKKVGAGATRDAKNGAYGPEGGNQGTPGARGTKSLPGAAGAAGGTGPAGPGSGPASSNRTGSTTHQDGSTSGTGSSSKTSTAAQAAGSTADTAGKASEAADKAGQAKGAMDTAKKAGKSLDGVAANAAGGAAQKAIEGKGDSKARSNAGRYAGAAASGAVAGAQAGAAAGGIGALPGAAIGAAKNVGMEGGKDVVDGASKITGGGPDAEPADKRLGAGGTGYERAAKKDGELVSKTAKGVAIGGAAAAAPPAMGLVMLMALLKWLKTMFFAMMAMAANAANLVWGFIVGVAKVMGKAIAAPFVAIGGLAAKGAGAVFGVAVTATVAPVATATSGIIASITAVAVLSTVVTGILDQAGLDGSSDRGSASCVVRVGNNGPGAEVPASTEANAKAVYSVLKSWGMSDENIAGILGNWSQESGIDPTSVEGIYNEPYRIGQRKQEAWDNEFTHIPGQSHGGIGLGQWSNGRTPMLLNYAQSKGLDWYTIEAQLAFMVEGDNPGDVDVFKGMIETSLGSPGAAARHFHDKWERSADNASMMAERVVDAEMWYGKMSGWEVDGSIVGGVEDIVGGIIATIGGGVNTILGNCENNETVAGGDLVDGGMNEEQAQQLIELYNQEGDKFLDERYGNGGGPGSCGDNHAMNCVSFSVYFVNKYTSFQQYPAGDGIQTAHSIASMTGKQVSDTPTAYSVGSGPGTGSAGHTLVVLGVNGDQVIIGEAGYCAHMGRVRVDSAARMKAEGWVFVDVADLISETGPLPASEVAA